MQETRDPQFEALLAFIKSQRGFDFTGYKRPSLLRRVGKRMQKLGIQTYDDYRHYLDRHEDEFVELFNTILINVTGFFRDMPAWEYVQAEIVPRVVEARRDEQIRIWSTGCATGEEAFTIAMVFAEAIGETAFADRVKIYATDLDEDALDEGRHAIYAPKAVEPVPPELRDKYFQRYDSRYAFRPELRRSVIFGRHDLVQDAPISRVDLLVSRNTLMYFDSDAQGRILANFHFALNPAGFLFLGKSEVLLTRASLFVPVDLKRRVFTKVAGAGIPERVQAPPRSELPAPLVGDRVRVAGFDSAPFAQLVVDTAGTVVALNQHARTMFGLHHRDVGRPLQDLEVSYRPVELRSRIDQVYAERHAVMLRDVEWRIGGDDVRALDLQVSPLSGTDGTPLGVSIAFLDVTRFRRLRDELETSRRHIETAYEELQSTVEELETTNEELQSTNEELETTNEELQSTNEELETMNEEMQSTNEELETMNDELQIRTDELNEMNVILDSVLGSLAVALVVVDAELRVELWNGEAEELWGVRRDEAVGAHLLNLDVGLPLAELREPIRGVLAGRDIEPVVVDGVNRRGRPIRCRVALTALRSLRAGGAPAGAIVLMEEADDGE